MNNLVKTTSGLALPSNMVDTVPALAAVDFSADEPAKLDESSEVFALRFDTGICPACGDESEKSDVFCISCGEFLDVQEEEELQQKMVYCTECGTAVSLEEIFCLSCGGVLD